MPNKTTTPPVRHHRIRTFFAGILGSLAVSLILLSVVVVWLNRTLTDTHTFVGAIAPLAQKAEIQNFVATKVSDQLVDHATPQDLASVLLPASQTSNQTPDQLVAQLRPIVKQDVLQVVKSDQFAALWRSTVQSAHSSLTAQLNSGSTTIKLDLSPAVAGVLTQVKASQLAPVADKLDIPSDAGNLNLHGGGIAKAHQFYKDFKSATLLIVLIALVTAAAAVALSVHHAKTMRRILVGVGVVSFVIGLALSLPALISGSGADAYQTDAARTVIEALVRNLQIFTLVLGLVCIASAIGWKLYERRSAPLSKTSK